MVDDAHPVLYLSRYHHVFDYIMKQKSQGFLNLLLTYIQRNHFLKIEHQNWSIVAVSSRYIVKALVLHKIINTKNLDTLRSKLT